MQLTPEQKALVEQARKEGRHRVHLETTEEQRTELQRAIALEEEGREENIAAWRRRQVAESEPGFAGDLRRAITAALRDSRELATEIGIDVEQLEGFREGLAELPSDALTRLISVLGLRLMAEIPA